MIRISNDILVCPTCGEELQVYYERKEINGLTEIFKHCSKCLQVYCVSVLMSNGYCTR